MRSSSASDRECRAWFHHHYSQQLPTATLKLLRGRHENNTGIKLQLVYSNIDLLFNRLENVLWFKQQVAIVNFSGNFWLLINVDFSYEFCVWPNIVSSPKRNCQKKAPSPAPSNSTNMEELREVHKGPTKFSWPVSFPILGVVLIHLIQKRLHSGKWCHRQPSQT